MGDKQYEDLSANISIIILNMDDPSAPSKRLVACIKKRLNHTLLARKSLPFQWHRFKAKELLYKR